MTPAPRPHARRGRQAFLVLLAPLMAGLLASTPLRAGELRPAPEEAPRPEVRNVLLITLDTTRADYLSSYGNPLLTTPHIDRLARQGVRFTRASAVIPLTGPGHASMLTGLYPRDHGAIRNGVPMREDLPTLTTILAARRYATAAFVSGWTLRSELSGLQRGFGRYDDEMTDRYQMVNDQRLGDQTADEAIAWLQQRDERPFFLWVHFFDPHEPYRDHRMELPANPTGRGKPAREGVLGRYAQEVAFTDAQVGRILAALEATGAGDTTLIALTSDHGESFGEHGRKGHGRELYETTQHVPLILVHPALGHGKVADLPVSTLDITPTILDLLDLPPVLEAQGIALAQAVESPGSFAGRAIYQETFPGARKKFWRIFAPRLTGDPTLVGVRRGDWKAILDPKRDILELYDLASDPGETRNLVENMTVRAARFRPMLTTHAARDWQPPATQTALSDEDRKRLESLGYID